MSSNTMMTPIAVLARAVGLYVSLLLLLACGQSRDFEEPQVDPSETPQVDPSTGGRVVNTPAAFVKAFGVESLQFEEIVDGQGTIVQSGCMVGFKGVLLRFDEKEARLSVWTVDGRVSQNYFVEYSPELVFHEIIQDEELIGLVTFLVTSASVTPLTFKEATLVWALRGGGAESEWLFEYRDGLGGVISMVTAENLLDDNEHADLGLGPIVRRDHREFREAFEAILSLAAEKGDFDPKEVMPGPYVR